MGGACGKGKRVTHVTNKQFIPYNINCIILIKSIIINKVDWNNSYVCMYKKYSVDIYLLCMIKGLVGVLVVCGESYNLG